MRITESKLRKIIRNVILENEIQQPSPGTNPLNMHDLLYCVRKEYNVMRSPHDRGSFGHDLPEIIKDIISTDDGAEFFERDGLAQKLLSVVNSYRSNGGYIGEVVNCGGCKQEHIAQISNCFDFAQELF